MRISSLKPVIVSFPSSVVASLCCVLPLAVVLLGIGSGAFMMYAMRYNNIFIPIGVVGVGLGYFLYFRERKKRTAMACRMAGGRFNLIALVFATVVVFMAIVFNLFPEAVASLLAGS
ncbi:MAG: hypothetical protein GTO24_09905 [candidate division Zixibacteria bacterium]|nr:hypothetical protein [candidate division Zixibacteria bacterium]